MAVVLVCCLGAVASCRDNDASGSAAIAGVWSGHTYGKVVRSERHLMSASYSWRGDYTFRVDDDGNLTGHATVSYDPTFDATGVNAALSHITSSTSTILAGLPFGIGALSGAMLNSGVAVTAKYGRPMPVRSGSITGSLRNGKLKIKWDKLDASDGAKPRKNAVANIPVSVYLQLNSTTQQKRIYQGYLGLSSPWPGTPTHSQHGVSTWSVTRQSTSSDDGVDESTSYSWDAHRTAG